MHDRAAADRWPACRGSASLLAGEREIRAVQGEIGGHGDGWNWQSLANYVKFVGIHRRRNGAGLRGGRGTDGYGVCAVSSDGDGMAAGGAGNFGDGGGSRRGRHSAQQERRAVHGAVRPQADGTIDEGRGGAVDLHRGERGPRNRAWW